MCENKEMKTDKETYLGLQIRKYSKEESLYVKVSNISIEDAKTKAFSYILKEVKKDCFLVYKNKYKFAVVVEKD